MSEAGQSVVAIDIGTHKVSVLIGRMHAPNKIQVLGMAYAPNRGMNKGKIVSLDKVVAAIKSAVQDAEDMAECRVHSAWVAIPTTEMQSHYASGRTQSVSEDRTITTNEVVKVLELAKASHVVSDQYLVSAVPLGFSLDDHDEWVQNPLNLSAQHITGHYQLMMLPINVMQNLDKALKGAGIGVEKMVVSSLATTEATLLRDEREYGVCLVDIGAGVTSVSVYLDGRLALVKTIQRGGEYVTRDIAAVLQTTTEEAERIKNLHGGVDVSTIKPDHMIQVHGIDGPQTISRLELADIVIARYEEIFCKIKEELEHTGAIGALYHGVVLTGDGSQIDGAVNLARRIFGVSVHLANHPAEVYASEELQPMLERALFATASGLLMYSQYELQQTIEEDDVQELDTVWGKIAKPWQNFSDKLRQLF